jgi:hypothetical protein
MDSNREAELLRPIATVVRLPGRPPKDRLIGTREASTLIGLPPDFVRGLVRRGEVPSLKICGRIFLSRAGLIDFYRRSWRPARVKTTPRQ